MIKQLLLISILLGTTQLTFAQALPNGGFENWNSMPYDNLDMYQGSNPESLMKIGQSNCIKTTDKQNGSFAVRLETKSSASDTVFGYFVNGDPDNGSGGMPYSQSPTTINGYYKCGIQAGDTALLLVVFKSAGAIISQDIFHFTGTQNSYTAFTFNLNTLSVTPDSVIIGAASSNAFVNDGIPGSFLQLDNLSFGGTGITQGVPNGDFENWTTINVEDPTGWSTRNLNAYQEKGIPQVLKIFAPYSGVYAMQMTTLMLDGGNYFLFDVTTGEMTDNGYDHGLPYNQQTDTLTGYYKYLPSNIDTASVMAECYKNGVNVGGGYLQLLSTGTTYTPFKMPITCSQIPDSMSVHFFSSTYPVGISQEGSALILDNLSLISDPLGIYFYGKGLEILVFPNPAVNELNFNLKEVEAQTVEIIDISGKTIEVLNVSGKQNVTLDTQSFKTGVYFYKLINKNTVISRGKFNVVK